MQNKIFLKKYNKNNSGFIALTSVILITAVIVFVVTSLSLQMIDEANISSAYEQSKQAHHNAIGCAEYVLLQISNTDSYTATGNVLGNDSCEIVSMSSGYPKTIQIRSAVGNEQYTVEMEIVVATTTPQMTITEWNQWADF